MDSRDHTMVELRCSLCDKAFDKYTSFKRHGYYCRSKPSAQRASRGRSCGPCARAKVRCDTRTPNCSRCLTKALHCQYGYVEKGHQVSRPSTSNITGPVWLDQPSQISGVTSSRSAITELVPFGGINNVPESIEFTLQGINGNLEDTYTSGGDVGLDPLFQEALFHGNLISPKAAFAQFQAVPASSSSPYHEFSDLALKLSPNLGLIGSRVMVKANMQASGSLMLRILCSYPKMMIRPENFPPFIHPQCFGEEEGCMVEPITNCMSLMQLFNVGNQNSRKLLWSSIVSEQERVWAEHKKFSKWQLLGSMQALLIYLLLRLADGETEQNNIDMQVLSSIELIGQYLSTKLCTTDVVFPPSAGNDWKEWTFEESIRRTVVVFRILRMIVDFNPVICNVATGFVLAPLPARKTLWEAPNEAVWKAEMKWGLRQVDNFGLLPTGDLVRLRKRWGDKVPYDTTDRSAENWQEWCAGMDGFGALVMIAASLL